MEFNTQQVTLHPSLMGLADEVIIAPVGDLQLGARGADLDKFKRHIDWCMKHDAYMIGMGDFVDVVSPSGQKKLAVADFYESVMDVLTEAAYKKLMVLLDVLKGTEGRWLGFHDGHHKWLFGTTKEGKKQTTDSLLAEALVAPFLDWSAVTTLTFKKSKLTAQIHSTHGNASSVTMAGPLTKMEQRAVSFPDVDIFLEGHCARKVGYPRDGLVRRKGKMASRRRIYCTTGGFCRGYLEGSTTYVEQALMRPLNMGAPLIFVRPIEEEGRLDMNLSL